jgi:hypothetical protein
VRTLRFSGENDDAFRARAERAGKIARVLIEACLQNKAVQEMIADPLLPYTVESVRRHPIVRVEFEHAFAVGGIGECLDATKNKHWGDGPRVMPLQPDDPVSPDRILYVYKENSLYNRRFEQRRRLKELLGPHRPLVEEAKRRFTTKARFLTELTDAQRHAIARLGIDAGDFWRACKGKLFLELPPRFVQRTFFD